MSDEQNRETRETVMMEQLNEYGKIPDYCGDC